MTTSDLFDLQGIWILEDTEYHGKEGPGKPNKKITFTAGRYESSSLDDRRFSWGPVQVYLDQTPKAIDLITEIGPYRGQPTLCIFEIEGDVLHLCASQTQRPTDFKTREDVDWLLSVYRKQ